MCNDELGDATIEQAFISLASSPSITAAVEVVSSILPATLAAGACVDFSIGNAGVPAFQRGDSLTLVSRHLNENQEGFITFFLLDEAP